MRPLAVGLFFSCVCAAPGYAGSVLQSQATGLARATSSLQPEVTGTADTGLRVSLRSHEYGREDRLYETVLPAQTAFEAYALGVLNLQGTFLVPVEVKRGPDRVDLDLLLANEWAFANQREPPRLTRAESVPLVRGEAGTCRPGVALAGQRLTVISCLQGQATTSVIDAHQLKPQLCRVGLDDVSGARPCGVSTRDGSLSCAESASWRACVHRGEPTLTSGWWQPRQRPGLDLESGLFFEPMGMTGLPAYQPVIEGPLFENDGVVRVAFGQGDGGVEWREIPAPKAGTGQVQLKALVERGGSMATAERWRLASGAIVQMNQGGVEATGSREGVVAFPSLDGGSAEVTLIDSGRAALLGSMLLIDAARDIGGDMSGDSDDLATPKGAKVITHTGAGAFEVSRLEAVNLVTHQRIDTPWDSHLAGHRGSRSVRGVRPTHRPEKARRALGVGPSDRRATQPRQR